MNALLRNNHPLYSLDLELYAQPIVGSSLKSDSIILSINHRAEYLSVIASLQKQYDCLEGVSLKLSELPLAHT